MQTYEVEPASNGEINDNLYEGVILCLKNVLIDPKTFELPQKVLSFIKAVLRNTMTDERLSKLGVLSIEPRMARAINLDDFLDVFA